MENLRTWVRAGSLMLLLVLLSAAGSCPSPNPNDLFDHLLEQPGINELIQDHLGVTIHVLIDPLPAGTEIYPDVPGAALSDLAGKRLTCEGPCFLAMIDLMPRAHFAHEVVIAVYDLDNGEFDWKLTDWWPWVPNTKTRYFHTVAERRRTLVTCRPDCQGLFPDLVQDLVLIQHPPLTSIPPTPTPVPLPGEEPRSIWAVIVNGYHDPDDSFDEDTDGIYRVLKGMGVPDWQICYLTDDTNMTGRDTDARLATVENALRYIAQETSGSGATTFTAAGQAACGAPASGPPPIAAATCSEFLLFFSSHGSYPQGNVASLICNHHKVGGGVIKQDDLTDWMSGINADRNTLVIEACYSGAFLESFKQLCTDPKVCSVFLSSGETQKSFADLDPPKHPDKNPGDAGSETIWGFVEAFGTSQSDLPDLNNQKDRITSFAEAIDYAIDNDATTGNHTSVVWQTTATQAETPYLNRVDPQTAKLAITSGPYTAATTTDSGGATVSLIQRCRMNTLEFEIENVHNQPLSVGTVRLHVVGPQGGTIADWDHANTMILPGLATNTTIKHTLEWRAGRHLEKGDQLTVVASVDSPQALITANPLQTQEGAAVVVNPPCTISPCGCRSLQNP